MRRAAARGERSEQRDENEEDRRRRIRGGSESAVREGGEPGDDRRGRIGRVDGEVPRRFRVEREVAERLGSGLRRRRGHGRGEMYRT
jgi:hypothetical protein